MTFASQFLFPWERWFFRRHDMILRLMYDPKVIEAVAEHAPETGVRQDVAFQEAPFETTRFAG